MTRELDSARQALLDQIDLLHASDLAAVATYSVDRGPRLVLGFTTDRQQLKWAVATLGSATQTERVSDPLSLSLANKLVADRLALALLAAIGSGRLPVTNGVG